MEILNALSCKLQIHFESPASKRKRNAQLCGNFSNSGAWALCPSIAGQTSVDECTIEFGLERSIRRTSALLLHGMFYLVSDTSSHFRRNFLKLAECLPPIRHVRMPWGVGLCCGATTCPS